MEENLDKIFSLIMEKGGKLLVITVIFMVYQRYSPYLVSKIFNKYPRKNLTHERRINTFYKLLLNIVKYIGIATYIYLILNILGVPVTTLIAGAGILSIGIGLGAQSFFNDTITGFFILVEKQFDVGDYIVIETVEGYVTAIGIRTTQIKSNDGVLSYVPNRKIGIVNNLSKSEMRIAIDIPIFLDESLFKIEEIVNKVNENKLVNHPEVNEKPNIQGLTLSKTGDFYYRVTLRTRNANQTQTKSAFYKYYITELISSGIKIPDVRKREY